MVANNKQLKSNKHLFWIAALFFLCSLLYYLPTIIGLMGGTSAENSLNELHNFYGLDFYAIIFFIPVVYAAYSIGVIRSVIVALAAMIVFTPYSIFILDQPEALFRPSAFVIIMSAVGAVVAMLQKGDLQRRRSMDELNCLYDIGKAAEKANIVEMFLKDVAAIITRNLAQHADLTVTIVLGNIKIVSNDSDFKLNNKADIYISGELKGYIEIAYQPAYAWDKKLDHFTKTLAERVGGAVHGIELEISLNSYYEQLESMVESRTRELEIAHEKLVRSERLAAVGELASGVGHELRNPLNVIRNCVYLINMGLENTDLPDVQEALTLLDLQVDISNNIVTDLMDFTRVKQPVKSEVELNNIIHDRIAWANIPETVKVNLNLSSDIPRLYIDQEQCGRAFTNIISNAVQAMGNSGELRIRTGYGTEFGWISFSDNGCGISPENMHKIFEPLFTTKSKGIGLGLAITKRMIEQNGGEIKLESELGKGTTFTITLPLTRKEAIANEKIGQNINC